MTAWWSEHPKYAFQMHMNSMSGVEHIISDFNQRTSWLTSMKQHDLTMSKLTGRQTTLTHKQCCDLKSGRRRCVGSMSLKPSRFKHNYNSSHSNLLQILDDELISVACWICIYIEMHCS